MQQQQLLQQQAVAMEEAECGELGEMRGDAHASVKRSAESVSGPGFLRRKFSGFWKKKTVAADEVGGTRITVGESADDIDSPPKVPPKISPPVPIDDMRKDESIGLVRPVIEIVVTE
jgi:hypothetical protein